MNSNTTEQALNEAAQLFQAGNLDKAEDACLRLLEQSPEQPQALQLLGFIYFVKQDSDSAVDFLKRATDAAPDNIEAHFNLARALEELGQFEQALSSYQTAHDCLPGDLDAINALGRLHTKLNNQEDAEFWFRQIIDHKPDQAAGHVNLGNILSAQRRFKEAESCYRTAIEIDSQLAPAWNGLGRALSGQNRFSEAAEAIRQALTLNSDFVSAYINLGDTLKFSGDPVGAIDQYREALKRDPENTDAHFNLSLALLMSSDFNAGWPEYEWRWQWENFVSPKRQLPQSEWNGESLDGKSVVAWGEQGIGDEIMFAGMLPDLIQETENVIVECEPRLLPLFMRSFPNAAFLAKAEPAASELINRSADYQIATGSLGRRYRQTLEAFPQHTSYLKTDPQTTQFYKEKYRGLFPDKRLIGISWKSGNEELGAARSASLDLWQPVFEHADCAFINLQYGDVGTELQAFTERSGIEIYIDGTVDPLKDMDKFAAQLSALDLIISIDNSTVHLAGALGMPTWTLLPTTPDWRWMLDVSESPWYPAMQLIRQSSFGNWEEVFDKVSTALTAH